MFYSHEILTSREYGVATVWLVATLGAKSNTKKVTRKAILDVDVRKACNTILQPVVPLALPLSSNLLYGVSRVYSQQCSYVLADAQTAQNHMRALLKVMRDKEIDQNAGKVRRDQLTLPDDPAFIAETEMPSLELDLSILDLDNRPSQHSSLSMLSPKHRSSSASSSRGGSIPGINLGSSVTGGSYQLPHTDPFAMSSVQKYGGSAARLIFDDEQELYQDDDLDFGFDADGNLVDIPLEEREARRAGSLVRPIAEGSEADAIVRMKKDFEEARRAQGLGADAEGDINMDFDDDGFVLPEAEPFPMMSGALQGPNAQAQQGGSVAIPSSPSSTTVEAPLKRRKPKARKVIEIDTTLTLKNNDLILLSQQYSANMATARNTKIHHKAATQAKKNASYLAFGSGLGGVGSALDRDPNFVSPLAEFFSGPALLSAITGRPIPIPTLEKGRKRAADPFAEEQITPKRPRLDMPEDELPMGLDDDGMMMQQDDSIEVGRDAATALQDYPSSAAMPWNVSASLRSKAGSSIPGSRALSQSLAQASQVRRMPSASPLVGRGSALPGDIAQLSQFQDLGDGGGGDEAILYGRSDDSSPSFGFGGGAGSKMSSSQHERDEFELFGIAAGVDTQTAGQSQWMREALDRESLNFLDFLTNSIAERGVAGDRDGEEEGGEDEGNSVLFEELFDPDRNTAVVAAQAFYHVLSLITKGKVWVHQEVEGLEEGEPLPWGRITLGVVDEV